MVRTHHAHRRFRSSTRVSRVDRGTPNQILLVLSGGLAVVVAASATLNVGLPDLLLDGGWLTEVRTGAAGAVAIDHLAPDSIATVAVLGGGSQARHQA